MTADDLIRVDYAGPGGACQGIRHLGLDSYGIEYDAAACATRAAAGHRTIRADLATWRQPPHARAAGYWASPPCQTFSLAGKGDGRDALDDLLDAIYAEEWAAADRFDPRTRHVLDTARVAVTSGAPWIALEQVPDVLPLWRALAVVLDRHGYSTWAGVLLAADYGVPQKRRRAILMASRQVAVAPPPPTHADDPQPTLFGPQLRPWISMAEALGWGFHDEPSATITGRGAGWTFGAATYRDRLDEYVRLNPGRTPSQPNRRTYDLDEPAPTIAFGHDAAGWRWVLDRRSGSPDAPTAPLVPLTDPAPTVTAAAGGRGVWVWRERHVETPGMPSTETDPDWPLHQPATTVVASQGIVPDPGSNANRHNGKTKSRNNGYRIEPEEAAILQGFPIDYPFQGSRSKRFEQIGNAVPPPLAAHVVAALTGRTDQLLDRLEPAP